MAKTNRKARDKKGKAAAKRGHNAPARTDDMGRELISWRAHPFMLEKRKSAILVSSTLAFAALVWYAYDLISAILTLVICVGAFAGFVLPTDYKLTEVGMQSKNGFNKVTRKWTAFANYHTYSDGIQLMYHQRSLRERILKGVFVYYGEADAERIKDIITQYVIVEDESAKEEQ